MSDLFPRFRKAMNTLAAEIVRNFRAMSQRQPPRQPGQPPPIPRRRSNERRPPPAEYIAQRTGQQFREALERTFSRQNAQLIDLAESLIRPQGRPTTSNAQREIRAAEDIIRQIEAQERPDPGFREAQSQVATPPSILQPERRPGRMPGVRVGGRRYQFAPDDPILTGQMINVSSSNVHSIGYVWNYDNPMQGTLKVRFLATGERGKRSGPGPIYDYYSVHPEVFIAFRIAASAGRFVWDRLRIRGTVAGHRYRYDLSGLGEGDYVPRRATRYARNEYFLQREFVDENGNVHRSQLQDEFVQRLDDNRPPPGFVPRGTPNRGRPGNGSPNRGR